MRHRHTISAFTLVELMVVVAIIAALISILLPSMSKARTAAAIAKCLSNTRQLNLAYQALMVTRKYRGLQAYPGPPGEWNEPIGPYISNALDLKFCPMATAPVPGDPTGSASTAWTRPGVAGPPAVTYYGSYGMNGFLFGECSASVVNNWQPPAPYTAAYFTSLNAVDRPADVPLFADCNWVDLFPHHDNIIPTDLSTGIKWNTSPGGGNGIYMLGRVVMDRHLRRTSITYTDGHSESVPIEQMWNQRWSRVFVRQGPVSIP